MIDFFCNSVAASNFCDDRMSAQNVLIAMFGNSLAKMSTSPISIKFLLG